MQRILLVSEWKKNAKNEQKMLYVSDCQHSWNAVWFQSYLGLLSVSMTGHLLLQMLLLISLTRAVVRRFHACLSSETGGWVSNTAIFFFFLPHT